MKKVIVVGGGVAGLAAGKRLADSGRFSVKLLEGDSRVGGRVHTIPLGNHFVENGAQWVHGEDGNQICSLARPLKLLEKDEIEICPGSADSVYVTYSGRILDKNIHEKIAAVFEEIEEGPEDSEIEGSVGDWAKHTFRNAAEEISLGTGTNDDNLLNAAILDWSHRLQCDIDGSDNWFQVSLFGQHEYWECEGNSTIAWEPPACYASILGVILNNSPTLAPIFQPELPSWINLQKEVTKIELLETDKESVQVSCSDGTTHTCDFLLCTVSLGVLKHRHKTMFHPPLPNKKSLQSKILGLDALISFISTLGLSGGLSQY